MTHYDTSIVNEVYNVKNLEQFETVNLFICYGNNLW
jgi:hypothetical protein